MGPNLQAVELDEDGAPPARPPAPADARRRRRWPWVASALALVGALAVAQHVVDARRTAHLERFDDVPGVVLPLQHVPARLWDWPAESTVSGEVGQRVVTVRVDGEGVVEGLARGTGRVEWTARLTLPDPADGFASGLECRPLANGHGDVERLACVLSPEDPGVVLDRPEDREVVVLDGADGSVVARWTTRLQLWGVAGDRVVTASATGDEARAWTVTASDPDGSRAWSRTLDAWRPHTLPAGGGPSATVGGDADHVLLSAEGHAAVLAADGHVLRTLDADGATGWSLARGGALVRTSYTELGDGASGLGETVDALGVPAASQPFLLAVDDGSAADVVLALTPDGLAGFEGTSGRRLWTFSQVWLPGVLLDGRLYAQDATDVVALDVRTGRVLWRSPVPGGSTGAMFTDGRVLYTPTTDAIETFALDDGAPGPQLTLTRLGSVAEGVASDFGGLVIYLTPQDGVVVLYSPTGGPAAVVG